MLVMDLWYLYGLSSSVDFVTSQKSYTKRNLNPTIYLCILVKREDFCAAQLNVRLHKMF